MTGSSKVGLLSVNLSSLPSLKRLSFIVLLSPLDPDCKNRYDSNSLRGMAD